MEASGPRPIRLGGICLDCADAEEMAAFYCRVLGYEVAARDTADMRAGGSGWIALRAPASGLDLSFQAEPYYRPPTWPEDDDGAQQKMMHFEVAAEDVEAAAAEVIGAGGRQAPFQPPDRDPSRLRVMLDPAGHPFCLVDAADFA